MNWIAGCKFQTDKGSGTITGVHWRGTERSRYDYVTESGQHKTINAKEFEKKAKFVTLTTI